VTAVMNPVSSILLDIIQFYIYLVIASAIMSWLVSFNVINTRNHLVDVIGNFLYRITEPPLRPIRRIVPTFGGLDISPIILIFILIFIQRSIVYLTFAF
jgi:YggT family protein